MPLKDILLCCLSKKGLTTMHTPSDEEIQFYMKFKEFNLNNHRKKLKFYAS